MTVAYHKFNSFVEDLAKGKIDFATHVIKIALTNTQPVASQTVYDAVTNHPPPAAANGYPSGGATVTPVTDGQTGGVYTLGADGVTFTAAGGSIGSFAYAILYDSNGTKPLIAWAEYGAAISLLVGEALAVRFNDDPTDGTIFQLT